MAKKQHRSPKPSSSRPSQSQTHRGDKKSPPPDKPSTLAPGSSDVVNQQRLLDIFRHTFAPVLSSGNLSTLLQEVKQALFNRDFTAAFGKAQYLEAYAARWSPTRALCYASVLSGLRAHLDDVLCREAVESSAVVAVEAEAVEVPSPDGESGPSTVEADKASEGNSTARAVLRAVCIGGGAAELVAIASLLHNLGPTVTGDVQLLDSAAWGAAVQDLHHGVTTAPPLSPYASTAARSANPGPLVAPSQLTVSFQQEDALALAQSTTRFQSLLGTQKPLLVTLLFTLNELFTRSGTGATTAFLSRLAGLLPPHSLLLVVDSPGSYSETAVGCEGRRYPMVWLLDRILLGQQPNEESKTWRRWAKLESQDSVWFRLGAGLEYPIPLEDMRYQIHLYRVTEEDGGGNFCD